MKRYGILGVVLALAVTLTACGSTSREAETSETTETAVTETAVESTTGSNILVAVFSRTGENYQVGVIEKGNTMIVAEMVQEGTGADLFEIAPETPYPDAYDEMLDVATEEQSTDARPVIKDALESIDSYDTIFIGYPIWWGDMPNIVKTFLESYDFSGKTVIPFSTHAGSGFAGTGSTIQSMLPGATVMDGFSISGQTAQNNQDSARETVTDWLTENGF